VTKLRKKKQTLVLNLALNLVLNLALNLAQEKKKKKTQTGPPKLIPVLLKS
jgi:hypothetical protein